ncbi:MAG: acetylornithine deacetylase [Acidobacteriota bacterium]|jgi:acetylornithine deacetylase|nr:acetylornithine deacetylase [Acidobacteriota bacterium]
MTVEETLAELVSINSVSHNSNAEIINFLAARAQNLGWRVQLFPYMDERGVEKVNMVAVAGSDSQDAEVELALVGHTDTVPFDTAWTDALRLTERDGKLYGRGACDTKGFIAAALAATTNIDLRKLRRPLALVFTADEEVGCLGAKRLADARVLRARYSIVGEPTSLQPMRAGKGYCLAEIIVQGIEGHSAYPALGASAIFRAARLVNRLEKIAEELKAEQVATFEPPYTTLNVGLIRGGTAKNIIAGECRFTLEWRPLPGQGAAHLVDLVNAVIEDERSRDADFACSLEVIRLDSGMETAADSALVRLLEETTQREAGTISFGTEAPQMAELGAEAVVFGPGNIRVAHRTDEFVPVEDLRECVRVLSVAIEHFCL